MTPFSSFYEFIIVEFATYEIIKNEMRKQMSHHVCPVWVGYLLASPLRRLFQNPEKILAPYIREGMTILDVGCAMGFFSLPAARMVGPNGRVVCIDVQAKMIESLKKRALKSGVMDRIDTRLCRSDSLGIDDLTGKIDFAFAIAIVHEVPDASVLFKEICKALKHDYRLNTNNSK